MTLGWRFWCASATVLGMPLALFLFFLAIPDWDRLWRNNDFHFWAVSGTAAAAAVACALFIRSAPSLRETRTVLLALAFMSIAGIFAVHGLGTPGHIHSVAHTEMQLSAWLSVLAGAFFVACSAVALPEAAERWVRGHSTEICGLVAVGMGLYIGVSLASPDWLGFIPVNDRKLQLAFTFASLGLLSFGAWRYFQAFLFARLLSQWAMCVALVLLMEVQASLTWGRNFHYSWWEHHILYGAAFAVLLGGWAVETLRAGSLNVLAEALVTRDAVVQLNRGYARPIVDLVDAIQTKDPYTLGHVRRVAAYALVIGTEMNLSTLDRRKLALAGQMHDVGKIGTPDRILLKPGPLTPEEFEIIKVHVDRGYEIARQIKVLQPVAEAIRHHHEKLDGSGYPDGLRGDAIPLLSRIVAVGDAYDAMTSGRIYRSAISHEAAIEELIRCSGSHFDPACVDAFLAAFAKDRAPIGMPVIPGPASTGLVA